MLDGKRNISAIPQRITKRREGRTHAGSRFVPRSSNTLVPTRSSSTLYTRWHLPLPTTETKTSSVEGPLDLRERVRT